MSATHVSSIGGAGTAHFVIQAVQQSGVLFLGSSLGVVEGDVDKPLLFDSLNESALQRFDGLSGISIDTTAGVNPDLSAAGLPINVGFFSFRAHDRVINSLEGGVFGAVHLGERLMNPEFAV